MKTKYQYSQTSTEYEVHFKVHGMDYGIIKIPVGTKVHRKQVIKKTLSGTSCVTSNWWVDNYAELCPKNFIFDGKPSDFFLHDARHSGIPIPVDMVINGNKKFDT